MLWLHLIRMIVSHLDMSLPSYTFVFFGFALVTLLPAIFISTRFGVQASSFLYASKAKLTL